MELFFTAALVVVLSLVWFLIIMKLAKHTVGKDAKTWQIVSFLVLAGPVGWIVLLIIGITDIIENVFPKLNQ
jgi:TM2 domain-containing membrane protein YozV